MKGKSMHDAEEHIMNVTSKGQVTIPVEIRKLLGVKPEGKVAFRVVEGRVELAPVTMSLEDTFGAVTPRKRPEDFQEARDIAIEEHISRSHRLRR
jgi:AbrB family looped-hinge helix DNA binding protein